MIARMFRASDWRAQTKKLTNAGLAASFMLVLAACADGSSTIPMGSPIQPSNQNQQANGNNIGNGPVKVALILPLSSPAGSAPATSLRNAAEMAVAEFNSQDITILVKDDRGTAEGAQAAAQEAIAERAEIILGPLFAPTVAAVGQVAKQAGRPVIAFSTDATVAARNVFLLSFMPQADVRRVLSYASEKGKKSYAALIPQTAYGNVAETEFTQHVAQVGGRIVAVERYQANAASLSQAIARLKGSIGNADALFMPDDANGLPAVGAALAQAGITSNKVQFLGTGVWNEPRVLKSTALSGGWFAAPESTGFASFAQRYRTRYNSDPTRIATLSYDAVALVSALVRTQGDKRFSEVTLTNASGFSGQDGVFRFRQDGTNDRGLAVFQINKGAASVLSPAPKSFGGGSGT